MQRMQALQLQRLHAAGSAPAGCSKRICADRPADLCWVVASCRPAAPSDTVDARLSVSLGGTDWADFKL